MKYKLPQSFHICTENTLCHKHLQTSALGGQTLSKAFRDFCTRRSHYITNIYRPLHWEVRRVTGIYRLLLHYVTLSHKHLQTSVLGGQTRHRHLQTSALGHSMSQAFTDLCTGRSDPSQASTDFYTRSQYVTSIYRPLHWEVRLCYRHLQTQASMDLHTGRSNYTPNI